MTVDKLRGPLAAALIGVFCTSANAADEAYPQPGYFGEPIDAYSGTAQAVHIADLLFFARNWTIADGVGEEFNDHSCIACHAIPMPGGSGLTSDTFVTISSAVRDVTGGHAIQRYHRLADGTLTHTVIPEGSVRRKTPILFGAGLLEAVPLPNRAGAPTEPDGISGRPGGTSEIAGRFGWKARFADLESFDAAAFAVEIGLGSSRYPGKRPAPEADEAVEKVTEFIRHLDVPPRKLPLTAADHRGEQIFDAVGCAQCHSPTLTLSDASPLAAKRRMIHPYTDLLLHDMGPRLADGITEGRAGPSDFRTAALWGLTSSGPPYLHDGRAASIEAAILEHGGDVARTIVRYRALSDQERKDLIEFLRSL
jgi:CxxC motif-containing protein (DUF1111 family)